MQLSRLFYSKPSSNSLKYLLASVPDRIHREVRSGEPCSDTVG